jgi:hypothetical protein
MASNQIDTINAGKPLTDPDGAEINLFRHIAQIWRAN